MHVGEHHIGLRAGAGPDGYAIRPMTNRQRAAQNRHSLVGARHRASQ
jgi:hypothetical protein